MEDVGVFCGHLVHFRSYCYILWTLGRVCGNLAHFSRFGILCQEKSGNPYCLRKVNREGVITVVFRLLSLEAFPEVLQLSTLLRLVAHKVLQRRRLGLKPML
jgi:hypothetical protein